jgi:hypothetical protein
MRATTHALSVAIDWRTARWPDPRRLFDAWLRAGLAVLLLVPGAWDAHWLVGWLPFWLVGVPALARVQQGALDWRQRIVAVQRDRGRRGA